eukprot:COSAG02_NODE_4521_length_5267_cov_8.795666_6_plen_287_part_00
MPDEGEHCCAAVCMRTREECEAGGGLFAMGGCSHQICRPCLGQLRSRRCPQCREEIEQPVFTANALPVPRLQAVPESPDQTPANQVDSSDDEDAPATQPAQPDLRSHRLFSTLHVVSVIHESGRVISVGIVPIKKRPDPDADYRPAVIVRLQGTSYKLFDINTEHSRRQLTLPLDDRDFAVATFRVRDDRGTNAWVPFQLAYAPEGDVDELVLTQLDTGKCWNLDAGLRTLLDRAPLDNTDSRAGFLRRGTVDFARHCAENQAMRDRMDSAASIHSRNVRRRLMDQ